MMHGPLNVRHRACLMIGISFIFKYNSQ